MTDMDIDNVTRIQVNRKAIPGAEGQHETLTLAIADADGEVHHVRLRTRKWDSFEIDGAQHLLRKRA